MKGFLRLLVFFPPLFGVFCVEVKSVKEGDSVSLNIDVTKQLHDTVWWYFKATLIALINEGRNTSCLYDGEDGRFKGRLKVDYQTGSLTITDTRAEDTGPYEAQIKRGQSSGTSKSLNRPRKTCNSTNISTKKRNPGATIKTFTVTVAAPDPDSDPALSAGVIAGICVAVVLLLCGAVTAGIVIYRNKKRAISDPV